MKRLSDDIWLEYSRKRYKHVAYCLAEAQKYQYHSLITQYSRELIQLENRFGSAIRDNTVEQPDT